MKLEDFEDKQVSPADLTLDTNNPRLFDFGQIGTGRTESDLIKRLVLTSDINELLMSIAANGFMPLEPFIITGDSPPYRVLEGNRRLTAIRLFQNPTLAAELNVSLPDLSDEQRKSFDVIDTRHVKSENIAWPYIGFKHVNGPHKWSSLSKARFAAKWYRSEAGRLTVAQITAKLGDKHATVRKMLEGIFVLEQAEANELFSIDQRNPDKPFAFSHLYTALNRKEFREYLGIGKMVVTEEPIPDPVSPEKMPNLRTMLLWMFGNKELGIQSVVTSQNPDLGKLGKVLVNPIALEILGQQKSLSIAFDETVSKDVSFKEKLVTAYSSAREAMSLSYAYKGGDKELENIASQLRDIAIDIHNSMIRKTPEC